MEALSAVSLRPRTTVQADASRMTDVFGQEAQRDRRVDAARKRDDDLGAFREPRVGRRRTGQVRDASMLMPLLLLPSPVIRPRERSGGTSKGRGSGESWSGRAGEQRRRSDAAAEGQARWSAVGHA
jgi:hypothetical protein